MHLAVHFNPTSMTIKVKMKLHIIMYQNSEVLLTAINIHLRNVMILYDTFMVLCCPFWDLAE